MPLIIAALPRGNMLTIAYPRPLTTFVRPA